MSNNSIECRVFIISLLLTATLFSCGNKHNSQTETDMHKFTPKFPQKTVWIHHGGNESTAITFSSMEEAEWKLVHNVPNCSYEDFEKILLSGEPHDIHTAIPFSSIGKPRGNLMKNSETSYRSASTLSRGYIAGVMTPQIPSRIASHGFM